MNSINDAGIVVNKEIVDKFVGAYSFPLEISLPGNRSNIEEVPEEDQLLSILELDDSESDQAFGQDFIGDDILEESDGELYLDTTINGFIDVVERTTFSDVLEDETGRALEAFFLQVDGVPDLVAGTRRDGASFTIGELIDARSRSLDTDDFDGIEIRGLFGKIKRFVKRAWRSIRRAFADLVKRTFKFELLRTDVIVKRRPIFSLRNPLTARKVDFNVRVVARAGIKIFGRWRWVKITSPRISFSVGRIMVRFKTVNAKVYGRAAVDDFDWILKIKVFGFSFKVKIGLTGIIQRQLDKLPDYLLVDLSTFEREIPFETKKMSISQVDIDGDGSVLAINVETSVR